MTIGARLEVMPIVAAALRDGTPVVALESTLISHGLPYPANLEVAIAAGDAIRAAGGVPATIAIHDGKVLVGLDDRELLALATAAQGTVLKAARPNLAEALDRSGWAATTVSATMIAAHAAGIRVFATGGIGGVHRGALGSATGEPGEPPTAPTLDISSDLEELARTPVVVVCAGPKAILDVGPTLEYLETRGVPVVTLGQEDLPGFFSRSSGLRSPSSVADEAQLARRVALHLGLRLGSGILACAPVPEADALDPDVARAAVQAALAGAEAAGIRGPDLTPWLLVRVGELTEGESIRANTALIVNNAGVAGRLARSLAPAAK